MTETKMYTVPGMHCGRCTEAVERELRSVEGVESAEANLETKLVTVRGGELSDLRLRAAIEDAGYEAA